MKSITTLNKCKESGSLNSTNSEQACILLAIWGDGYIHDFLNLSLPSLLAPGNIPALRNSYNIRFVFLTRYADIPKFGKHPAFRLLENLCEIEFITIDDLLLIEFYSISLTLAYNRAIQQTGAQMLQTYFIFLTADFIFADGSLAGLATYMKQGYSGICTANFQALQEGLEPYLLAQRNLHSQTIAIKPRDLLTQSFKHLHPITLSNTINQSNTHNYRSNRFYLRYNEEILAGRFFLQHMLCIKPERLDYVIAESCDYSFIPAMCPSGNVIVINDSDDYLVVELQAKKHELNHVHKGSYRLPKLAKSLAAWTTQIHRQNARNTIYFHTRDISATEKAIIESQLNQWVATINSYLSKRSARPVINPKWQKTVEIFQQQLASVKHYARYEYFDLTPPTYSNFFKRWFYRVLGTPPRVSRFHYRFREYQNSVRLLEQQLSNVESNQTIVIYYSHHPLFMNYCGWLQKNHGITQQFYLPNLLLAPEKIQRLQQGKFQQCLLFALENDRKMAEELVKTLILPSTQEPTANLYWVVLPAPAASENILAIKLLRKIDNLLDYNKKLKFLFYLLLGVPGSLLYLIYNCLPSTKYTVD